MSKKPKKGRSLYGVPVTGYTVKELTDEIDRLEKFISEHGPTMNSRFGDRVALLKTVRTQKFGNKR